MNDWLSLLETAVRTPSPHNVQPWRVRVLNEREADLFVERGRTLPKEDTTGSFIILTMGMFIEALKVLAANRSLSLAWELRHAPEWYAEEILRPGGEELMHFARLRLSERGDVEAVGEAAQRYEDSLFLRRRTSRVSLLPKPVEESASRALAELADRWGQRYEQVTDAPKIERILRRNTDALFEDLNSPAYHDEIVEWFRFTDRAARRTRDGLDYRCMNSSRASFWAAARMPGLLLLPFTRQILARVYRKQLGVVPTIGLLSGPFWEPASAFETGRFLMRFWLEAARRGLYIHPYGNLVTNRGAAEWRLNETGVADIWLVFKIGYSEEPPASYRRTPEEVLVV
jgi:nitroreductase